MSNPKQHLPMPTVIAIVGIVLVLVAGGLFYALSQPSGDSGVYKVQDTGSPTSARNKQR